jgi:FkbM family methyltransferase
MTAIRRHLAEMARALGLRKSPGLFHSHYLRSLGFTAKTIVDIGVYKGTRPLYQAFSECLFILVDPQRNIENLLLDRPSRCVFVNKGLAATKGRLTLREQAAGKTTFLSRTPLTAERTIAQYDVEVTTLDRLLGSIQFEPPIGIKIDTEGYELEVLKGLTKYWVDIEFVICEASIKRRFDNSYQMSELITYMLERDFMIFNFLNLPHEHPRYYDILFLPRESRLFV